MGKSKDWMVWCRSRKKEEEQRPFEVDGKEIFSKCSRQAKPKAGEKTDKKGDKGQSVCWKAWWRQGNIKCAVSEGYTSCWVHQDCHVADEQEEGSRSNRPELAAFFLALRDTLIEEPFLYLCDNQSLLKAVTRWIGEGH